MERGNTVCDEPSRQNQIEYVRDHVLPWMLAHVRMRATGFQIFTAVQGALLATYIGSFGKLGRDKWILPVLGLLSCLSSYLWDKRNLKITGILSEVGARFVESSVFEDTEVARKQGFYHLTAYFQLQHRRFFPEDWGNKWINRAVRNPFLTESNCNMRSRNRADFEAHGDLYFITSTVVGFVSVFRYRHPCDIFVESLRFLIERGDLTLLAWVLMPNHFHLVAKRSQRMTISETIASLKRYTSRRIGELCEPSRLRTDLNRIRELAFLEPGKGTAFWKPRFDSLVITSEATLRQKIEYIHHNPVRKGLVSETWQWRYSSASAYEGLQGVGVPVDTEWRCLGYGEIPSGKDS